jgi:hypothetical protein
MRLQVLVVTTQVKQILGSMWLYVFLITLCLSVGLEAGPRPAMEVLEPSRILQSNGTNQKSSLISLAFVLHCFVNKLYLLFLQKVHFALQVLT